MSAAPALAFDKMPRRVFPRQPIDVPVDVIALRSGVPENLPGRCTDLSEAGVGAVVAGELAAGQPVAVELRLPNLGLPVRVRALVRYQLQLRCGLEFVGLSVEQREMIRYWVYRSALKPDDLKDLRREEDFKIEDIKTDKSAELAATEAPLAPEVAKPRRRVRIGRRGFFALIAGMLLLAALGWWQWQKSWDELEKRTPRKESRLRVPSETMVASNCIGGGSLVSGSDALGRNARRLTFKPRSHLNSG